MNTKRIFYFLFLIIVFINSEYCFSNFSQDTIQINKLIQEARNIGWNDTRKSIELSILAREKSTNINYLKGMFDANQHLTMCYYITGENDLGLNSGFTALKVAKQTKDIVWEARISNSLGLIYMNLENYNEAKRLFSIVLKHHDKKNDQKNLATALNNLSNACLYLKEYDNSLDYRLKSITIRKKLNLENDLGDSYNDLGETYSILKEYNKALYYFKKCLEIKRKYEDFEMIALSTMNLGKTYLTINQLAKSKEYFSIAEEFSKKIHSSEYLTIVYENLALVYEKEKQFSKQAKYLKLYIENREKLLNEKSLESINNLQIKHETENKQQKIELLNKERKIKDNEILLKRNQIKKQRLFMWFLLFIILFFIVFIVIITRFFIQKRKAHQLISIQKKEIEDKHIEITSSITYAKRIQSAILPQDDTFNEVFREYFIYYIPKDIVAGDFYWMINENNTVYIAAADCTGHGVPGALVSVVCYNALNRSVREFGLTDPGKILDKTREIVVQEFEKSNEDVKDGMDISLCILDINTNLLKWSGANNPLWILSKNSDNVLELIETKPNKQPIGKFAHSTFFNTHIIQLQKGDEIYLFTDGYQDQFGGVQNKKFKQKQMRELLLDNYLKNMDEKRNIIHTNFISWKKDNEQVDDITILGLKI
ncbi:MAG: tetratricopeptide repeat protein [Flavobacteriia bacterium]|nr:tetratricopeptide repeat protein [Flavobacteriia bacterium]